MATKSNSDTKTKALDLGREYLQTMGFKGFSFQTIADALGIKKASLHYHFSSKEELGIALLQEYVEGHAVWAKKVQDLPSKTKLEKMVKGFNSLTSKNFMICPIGSFTSDFQSAPSKLKKKIKQFHVLVRSWLVETIEQGKKEGTIKATLDSETNADLFLATLQGGVQVARIRGEQESLKKMLNLMLDNLHGK
jgi:TetR/AcrR family transcriptional repressor of nem operon